MKTENVVVIGLAVIRLIMDIQMLNICCHQTLHLIIMLIKAKPDLIYTMQYADKFTVL